MDNSKTSQLRVIGLVTTIAALIAGLHSLGSTPGFAVDWNDPVRWLNGASVEEAVAALGRYVGLAIGYWLLISTILYFITTAHSSRRRPRWVRLMTLPAIRRTVDRALATTLAFSIAATPIGSLRADEPPPPLPPVVYQLAEDGIPVPHIRLTDPDVSPAADHTAGEHAATVETRDENGPVEVGSVATTGSSLGQPTVTTPPPFMRATASAATESSSATAHTVERGDNLWSISAAHVESVTATEPTISAINEYWRAVIDANEGTLRSGDPNLIYPGEIITLPALEVSS